MPQDKIIKWSLWTLATFIATIGLLTLLGWETDSPILTSWQSGRQTMAPVTAMLSLLFSIALGLCLFNSSNQSIHICAKLISWLGILIALLLCFFRINGDYLPVEHLGFSIAGLLGKAPVGYISLITAFCFLLAFINLLILNIQKPVIPLRIGVGFGLASVILLCSAGFLFAYCFGLPLISTNVVILPAFNTVIILLLIGLALLLNNYQYFYVSQSDIMLTGLPVYLVIFIILSAGTFTLAYDYYRNIEIKFSQQIKDELLTIAKLKTDQLISWRKERMGNAIISQNILIPDSIKILLNKPIRIIHPELQNWLKQYTTYFVQFGYNQALYLDNQGMIQVTEPKDLSNLNYQVKDHALSAMQTGKITLVDFHASADGHIYLALIIPLVDKEANNQSLGALVITIDPTIFLYPLIQSWPTLSTSAETLLVRKEGNEVIFLNSLRFNPNAALKLRFPLTQYALPAVKAVLGEQGIVEGINYRGAPVLSAILPIPESPWFIIANEDKSEIYTPLHQQFWLTLTILSLVELSLLAITLFIWRQQQFYFSLKKLALLEQLDKQEKEHKAFIDNAMDGFLLMDHQGHLLEANAAYCQMSQYDQKTLLAMQFSDLETQESAKIFKKCNKLSSFTYESLHRRKDKSEFDVDVSIQTIGLDSKKIVAFIKDITARKRSTEHLQLAASVFTHAREGILITDNQGSIIQVNEAFSEITGYSFIEVEGKNPSMLSSGRQSKEFYKNMWSSLNTKGHWYGEVWNRHKNGEVYALTENISTVFDSQDQPLQYVALMSDITLIKAHEYELEHSAHYDALTNLPNRTLLADRLNQAIAQCKRQNQLLALVFVDLDGFKAINDEYGHLAGDQLLIGVANAMQQTLREVDTLARIGGDEFIALLVGMDDINECVPLFKRLLSAAAQPELFNDISLQVSASMGVTFYPQIDDVDADILIRQADQAMYQAKLTGKNRYHIFDIELDNLTRTHNESLESIRRALDAGEFVLYYQPKINLRLGKIVGVEALIRWQHPSKGLLTPNDFLPLIENHTLSIDIGEWVINTALNQIESWHKAGLNLPVSVNVGARQLQQQGFFESLCRLLKEHPFVKPGDLEIEVLETSAMKDLNKVSDLIYASKDIGIHFSLDDFGTGYSSLTYLKRLPVHQLKIDQSFVRDMLIDIDDLAIVEGVLSLASAFSLEVIAEGMETTQHGEMLLQIGCDLAQGYAIAIPMPAADLECWLSDWQPDPSWLNRPSFIRADLPLLFASAEYKVLFNAIEGYLHSQRSKPENLNSRFGTWLAINSPIKKGNYSIILSLHQKLMALAKELIDLHEKSHTQAVLARLPTFKKLQEAIFEKLKMLVEENWK
jgi:diguanylate cyclase (GGDEF)-like protein/PAS domain S-box-containing protein